MNKLYSYTFKNVKIKSSDRSFLHDTSLLQVLYPIFLMCIYYGLLAMKDRAAFSTPCIDLQIHLHSKFNIIYRLNSVESIFSGIVAASLISFSLVSSDNFFRIDFKFLLSNVSLDSLDECNGLAASGVVKKFLSDFFCSCILDPSE